MNMTTEKALALVIPHFFCNIPEDMTSEQAASEIIHECNFGNTRNTGFRDLGLHLPSDLDDWEYAIEGFYQAILTPAINAVMEASNTTPTNDSKEPADVIQTLNENMLTMEGWPYSTCKELRALVTDLKNINKGN